MSAPGRGDAARWGLLLLLWLVVGAIASVAVAWSIETYRAWSNARATGVVNIFTTQYLVPDPYQARKSILGLRARGFGSECWIIDRFQYRQPGMVVEEPTGPRATPPSWVRAPELIEGRGTATTALGFPFLCLKAEQTRTTEMTGPASVSTRMTDEHVIHWWIPKSSFFATLPIAPVWTGLIGSTFFYAMLAASPWAVRVLRRRRRVRRGLCPFCGYDLMGGFEAPCPECGRVAAPVAALA